VLDNFLATIMPLGPVQEKAIFGVYGAFLDDEIFTKS
jgi:TfoX/Sxy family transcriptional regulator of competence genes